MSHADSADCADAASRRKVRLEIEEIAAREAWDANSCLVAHRGEIMKLAPFVKFREEKFGAVLFETRSEKVYTLSPTGAAVVREVIAGAQSSNLVAKLKENPHSVAVVPADIKSSRPILLAELALAGVALEVVTTVELPGSKVFELIRALPLQSSTDHSPPHD